MRMHQITAPTHDPSHDATPTVVHPVIRPVGPFVCDRGQIVSQATKDTLGVKSAIVSQGPVSLDRLRERIKRSTFIVDRPFVERATHVSFELEGIVLPPGSVRAGLCGKSGRVQMRPRIAHRIRSHCAVLLQIERMIKSRRSTNVSALVGWYTTFSAGLCSAGLDDRSMRALSDVVHRINAPPHRVQAAIDEAARLHVELLREPAVPSFPGILARLVLHAQLGRCGLPPVTFDPAVDRVAFEKPAELAARISKLIERAYASQAN